MKYAHYYKAGTIGDGDIVFQRFSSTPLEDNSRFIQFVEGTLEEITAEDFGNITAIPSYILYAAQVDASDEIALKTVTMPDTITSIGEYSLGFSSVTYYMFSANIATIGSNVCNSTGPQCIIDFSKAKQIPPMPMPEGSPDSFLASTIASFRVPSALYSTWKTATGWSAFDYKMVSV